MNRVKRFRQCWVSCLCLVVLAGCAGGPIKQAIYLDPEFQPEAMGEIVLLPVQDFRIDKEIDVDLEKQVRAFAKKKLQDKDYQVTLNDNLGDVSEITEEDLNAMDPAWIKQLGPPEAHWVMVIGLLDVTTKLTFGSTGSAEVTGFLFDKETGKTIWRDKGIAQVGQGGLIGMAMKSGMDEEAIRTATNNLQGSIPKHSE